jgi:hypothetical protein
MATYTKEKDVATNQEDDSKARQAMEEVFGNTARWPAGFGGFSADVVVNINGKEEKGTVTAKNVKDIETTLQGEDAKTFLVDNIVSIVSHRGPRSFAESDGKYKLSFGDDGTHPLGRIVSMGGDGMSSFYRIKDGRIQQINRKTPRMAFTINIEESVKNQDDKYLTHKYTVYYFNTENGIKDVESYTDDYVRVGAADLPEYRRIINSEGGKIHVNSMRLSNHKNL